MKLKNNLGKHYPIPLSVELENVTFACIILVSNFCSVFTYDLCKALGGNQVNKPYLPSNVVG